MVDLFEMLYKGIFVKMLNLSRQIIRDCIYFDALSFSLNSDLFKSL